jgi:hypothetical protein
LDLVGRLPNGKVKQDRLLKARSDYQLQHHKVNPIVFVNSSKIENMNQLIEWIDRIKQLGYKYLSNKVIHSLLLRLICSVDVELFQKMHSKIEFEFQYDIVHFFAYLSQNYTPLKHNPPARGEFILWNQLYGSSKGVDKVFLFFMNHVERFGHLVLFWNNWISIFPANSFHHVTVWIAYMKQSKCIPNVTTFRNFCMNLDVVSAQTLVNEMKNYQLDNHEILAVYCRSCVSSNRIMNAIEFYCKCSSRESFYSQDDVYNMLDVMLSYASYHRIENAIKLMLTDIVQFNYKPLPSFIVTIILLLSKVFLPDIALEYYKSFDLGNESHNAVFAITNSYLRIGRITSALHFLQELDKKNIHIGKRTRLIVMNALVDSGQLEKAHEWLLDSIKFKDLNLVHSLMNGYLNENAYDSSNALLKKLESFGMKATDKTHSLQINWMLKQGSIPEAIEYLQKLSDSGERKVSDDVYACFLEHFLLLANWEKVEWIWQQIVTDQYSDKISDLMVKYFALRNQFENILKLIAELNPRTHPFTFRSMILVCLRTNKIDLAFYYFNQIKLLEGSNVKAYVTTEMISHFSRYCLSNQEWVTLKRPMSI